MGKIVCRLCDCSLEMFALSCIWMFDASKRRPGGSRQLFAADRFLPATVVFISHRIRSLKFSDPPSFCLNLSSLDQFAQLTLRNRIDSVSHCPLPSPISPKSVEITPRGNSGKNLCQFWLCLQCMMTNSFETSDVSTRLQSNTLHSSQHTEPSP